MKYSSLPIIKQIKVRPRLIMAICIGIIVDLLLPTQWHGNTKTLLGWDASMCIYLILTAHMMLGSDQNKIRIRAAKQDDGKIVMLCLTTIAAIASLIAIVEELATAKALTGHVQLLHIALAAVTVFLSWSFMQTIFALHYAHEYYNTDQEAQGGLEFPVKYTNPDYWDFVYFSFIIGTAAQTADINITSRTIRRIVTLHCIIVFFFNTTILALTVNIGAGLF